MKYFFLIIIASVFISCNQKSEKVTENSDSVKEEKSEGSYILNDLLKIGSMAELKKVYGEGNVIIDTIWGAEGMYTMGTKLFPGTKNEVQIMWDDTLKNTGMIYAEAIAVFDEETYEPVFGSEWKTSEGVYVGMSLEDITALNGKPIKFYGFGWDYSGMVFSFEKGKLENSKLGIKLINTANPDGNDELSEVIGDMEISTEGKDFSKYKIRVIALNVHAE